MEETILSECNTSSDRNDKKMLDKDLNHITYEFTQNPEFLKQYYKIREDCYREDLGLEEFSGEEDEYDRIGHIAVARIGDMVVGGAKLVIVTPNSGIMLPLEEDGFVMRNLFPELNLDEVAYCEITRFAISSDYRVGGEVSKKLTRIIVEKAININCLYQFSVAPVIQARNSRMIGKQIGVLHVIRNDIIVPHKPIYKHLNKQRICLSITYFFPDTKAT